MRCAGEHDVIELFLYRSCCIRRPRYNCPQYFALLGNQLLPPDHKCLGMWLFHLNLSSQLVDVIRLRNSEKMKCVVAPFSNGLCVAIEL